MIKRVHFWTRLMSGNSGSNKYIVMVENKGEEEDIPIAPHEYNNTFLNLKIWDRAVICLYNMALYQNAEVSEGAEEGEEEMEEYDDENQ